MTQNLSAIDLSGLQNTAQSQLAAVQNGQHQLAQAVNHAETLASTWSGDASQIYLNALSNFNESGNKLIASLHNMHGLMLETHSQFSNTNDQALDTARRAGQSISLTPVSAAIPGSPVTPGLPGL